MIEARATLHLKDGNTLFTVNSEGRSVFDAIRRLQEELDKKQPEALVNKNWLTLSIFLTQRSISS